MHSMLTSMLPFPQLLLTAHQDHVLTEIQNKALISIGQLCNIKFTAVLQKDHAQLNRDNITITSQRDPITGLYYIDLPQPPPVAPPSTPPLCLQPICNEYQGRACPIPTIGPSFATGDRKSVV